MCMTHFGQFLRSFFAPELNDSPTKEVSTEDYLRGRWKLYSKRVCI